MKAVRVILTTLLAATPVAAANFTVTNTDDSGPGSLRQAILDANATMGLDTIAFNIPGAGVHTISPLTALDYLTDPVVIDGYTQPGSGVNTDPVGTNAILLIELDGSVAGGIGLNLTGGASTIQGLVINRWADAIQTVSAGGNLIRGNFLGTDPAGAAARPNNVAISIGASGDLIGGTDPADRNLVSGNTAGVFGGAIQIGGASGVTIQGNLVGTDASGMLAVPNGEAIYSNMPALIGGTAAGSANVISGNSLSGIFYQADVVIQGNLIGVAADGVSPLGNGQNGILNHGAIGGTVGGLGPGEANVIAHNATHGVQTDGTQTRIRGNSIHDNGYLGIDLYTGSNTPKPNDQGDGDGGSNNLQNFPILQSVTTGATTHIVGKFNSTPSTTFDLDFYANSACSNFPREFLEGEAWIGTTQISTDGAGNAAIDITLPVATEAGARISATATDPLGNTSEFSQRIIFSMGPGSGPAVGGALLQVSGTDFADPTTIAIGGVSTPVTFIDDHTLNSASPALDPGTVNDVVVTTPDGTTGTLLKGWVSDFLDVPGGHLFYSFVTTLVSNAITVGVGGGFYGVDQPTKRQQMAVFLLKAEHGLCYTPPPCSGVFTDVPCSLSFAPWIEALAAEGITTGCGNGIFCPDNPVTRRQMAIFLLKTKYGASYLPPDCAGIFGDVACPGLPANFIEELYNENITGGCSAMPLLYCPDNSSTRGQMAVFITKTFGLQ